MFDGELSIWLQLFLQLFLMLQTLLSRLKKGLQKAHGFQDDAFGSQVALDDHLRCQFFGLRMLRLLWLFLISKKEI